MHICVNVGMYFFFVFVKCELPFACLIDTRPTNHHLSVIIMSLLVDRKKEKKHTESNIVVSRQQATSEPIRSHCCCWLTHTRKHFLYVFNQKHICMPLDDQFFFVLFIASVFFSLNIRHTAHGTRHTVNARTTVYSISEATTTISTHNFFLLYLRWFKS